MLQTLALIQRHADSPREVSRLARASERELRTWLYPAPAAGGGRLAAAVQAAAAEVEDAHGIPMEVVTVGDCTLDDRLAALVSAVREAMVNAAKSSGAPSASVYVEVEAGRVFASVRDRGRGFDVDAVPADRYGVRESIIGRTLRYGGTASVRSTAGGGTEVALEMPRA